MRLPCLGQTVTLTATPNAGYVFTGWSGDATGSANPLVITMDGDRVIGATFASSGGGDTAYVTGKVLGTQANDYTGFVGMRIGVRGESDHGDGVGADFCGREQRHTYRQVGQRR